MSIIGLGIVLFTISTTENGRTRTAYQVSRSKISLSGSLNAGQWTLVSTALNSTGEFELRDAELLEISNLSFAVPVEQFVAEDHRFEQPLQRLFQKNNCKQLTFSQQHLMILPIMKRVQVIGNFTLTNSGHSLPMQLHYELNNDRSIRIWGNKVISLAEFGMKVPSPENDHIGDDVELGIDLTLGNDIKSTAGLFAGN